ncbi:MAG: hypothetical protein ACM337_08915 [Syntrophaceae bacterium]
MMNLVATCCILLAFLSLSGCLHSVRLPDAVDREAVRTGEKAVVLLRHQSVYDSKPRETLGTYPTDGFGFEMGCLDEDDKPLAPVIYLSSPSEQARKEGWAYLVLKPGGYYLAAARAGADQNPPATVRIASLGRWGHLADKQIDLDRTWWFHVPPGGGVVYVGSFSNTCSTGRGIFGNLIDRCTEVTLRDETETARAVAAAHFDGYGPFRSMQAREYQPAFSIPRQTLLGMRWSGIGYEAQIHPMFPDEASNVDMRPNEPDAVYPMGFAVNTGRELAFPPWRTKALASAATMGGLIELRDLGGGYPPGAIAAAYLLFYLPVATLVGAISGDWKEKKWTPCAERLLREAADAEPLKRAEEAVLSAVPQGAARLFPREGKDEELIAAATRDRFRSVLKLELTRVSLMECGPDDSVSLDMAFRWRLWDTTSRDLLQERVVVFGNPAGRAANTSFYASRPWEIFLSAFPACRLMEQLCTERGYAEFRQELEKGIRETVRHILQ